MRSRTVCICLWLILPGCVCFGQVMVFPHFADGWLPDGTRWATEIDLLNTSTSEQSVSISFFNPNGTPKSIVFPRFTGLGSGPTFDLTLLPDRMRVLIIDSAFSTGLLLNTGWVLIEGTGGIEALLIFRRIAGSDDGVIISEVAFRPPAPTNRIDFFPQVANAEAEAVRTDANDPVVGYALANPDPASAATGVVQLFNGINRELRAISPFTLPPRGQMAEFVEQRFGPLAKGGL